MNEDAIIGIKPSTTNLAARGKSAPNLSVFISYANEDREIALALSNMLNHCFGKTTFSVFLDTKSIPLGGEINDDIKAGLREADVLILVSTGILRGSHSWGGFELGFFEACHSQEIGNESIRGKVITICTDNAVPGPTQNRRYVRLEVDGDLVNEDDVNLDTRIRVEDGDPLVLLLRDLLVATSGQKMPGRDVLEEYKELIKQFKKTACGTFRNRIRNVRKPQKQLLIRYNSKNVNPVREEIPADAVVTSVGDALSVFGIPEDDSMLTEVEAKETPFLGLRGLGAVKAKVVTWQRFRERAGKGVLAAARCNTLSRIVLPSGTNVNLDNSQVIVSHDKTHRYRVILTTSTSFYNGDVEASVYLVEALQRKDYGNEATTLLLKGLHIVCRFRFLLLEPKSVFHAINVCTWQPEDAPEKGRQLLNELDFILTEAKHAQLDQPGAWADFVSLEALQIMSEAWQPLEREIRKLCLEAIENATNEAEQIRIISELTVQLNLVVKNITPHNVRLLRAMSMKLSELAVEADHACA